MSSLKIVRLSGKFTKCYKSLSIFSLIPLWGDRETFNIFTIVLHDFENYNYSDLLLLLIFIYFRMWFVQAVLFHVSFAV
jgi:hypothetical protein